MVVHVNKEDRITAVVKLQGRVSVYGTQHNHNKIRVREVALSLLCRQGGAQCSPGGCGGAGVHVPLAFLPGLPSVRGRHEDAALLALPPGLPLPVGLALLEPLHRVTVPYSRAKL